MSKILAKELKIKFVETLNLLDDFHYEEGNPFMIKIGTNRYFIFLKNLSPAYFKNLPDITRVQLPYSKHFSKIFKAEIPFLILGYDSDNDTVVCWNPKNVKERLNAKSNVSLYSRKSLQANIRPNEFKEGYLSNGEKIILFKRSNLIQLFSDLGSLFKTSLPKPSKLNVNEPLTTYSTEKLFEIEDGELLSEIKPLLRKNKVLEAVEMCTNFYSGKYTSMSFKDWFKLVSDIYQSIDKQ